MPARSMITDMRQLAGDRRGRDAARPQRPDRDQRAGHVDRAQDAAASGSTRTGPLASPRSPNPPANSSVMTTRAASPIANDTEAAASEPTDLPSIGVDRRLERDQPAGDRRSRATATALAPLLGLHPVRPVRRCPPRAAGPSRRPPPSRAGRSRFARSTSASGASNSSSSWICSTSVVLEPGVAQRALRQRTIASLMMSAAVP